MQSKEYNILSHTADAAIESFGKTLSELFKNSLNGMFAIVEPVGPHLVYDSSNGLKHPTSIKSTSEKEISLHATNVSLLLVDFLSECLYLSDVHHEVYGDVSFDQLNTTDLQAIIYGTTFTHYQNAEIKAVTYHNLLVEETPNGWRALITFDI